MARRKSVKPRKYLYLFAAYKQPYQTFPLSLSFSSILISHFCWLYIESQIVQRPTSKLEVDSPILFVNEAEWRKYVPSPNFPYENECLSVAEAEEYTTLNLGKM